MPKQIFHSICFSENEHSWSINHLSIAHLKPGNQSQSIKITTRRNSSTLITITYSLQSGQLEPEGQGAMAAKTFCQITYLIIITNVVMGQIMPIRWLPTLPSPGFSDLPTALQGHIAQWVACASYCMYIASNTIWHTTHFYIYPKQGSKQAKKTLPPQYVPLTYMDILLLRL